MYGRERLKNTCNLCECCKVCDDAVFRFTDRTNLECAYTDKLHAHIETALHNVFTCSPFCLCCVEPPVHEQRVNITFRIKSNVQFR